MKKVFISLFVFLMFSASQSVLAQDVVVSTNRQLVNNTDYSKAYKTNSENLLYLLLSAINEYNYSIQEIQFKTGSVLFKAYTKEFIASVSAQDGFNSFVKIIPADNNYNFSPDLLEKLHSYIELNDNINFQKVL